MISIITIVISTIIAVLLQLKHVSGYRYCNRIIPRTRLSQLQSSNTNNADSFFDDERVAEMTLDEIKAELEVRAVNYDDCFSKRELVQKLGQARREGKATPDIFNQFNELSNDDVIKSLEDKDKVEEVLSKDGRLPGGLAPEVMKELSSDPEIMTMLRDPKMQDIMKAVMTGGPQGLQKYTADPDSILLLNSLSKAMERVLKKKT
jgi:hypothetical protein